MSFPHAISVKNYVHLEGDETQHINANDNGSGIEYSIHFTKNTKWFYQSPLEAWGYLKSGYISASNSTAFQSRYNVFGVYR